LGLILHHRYARFPHVHWLFGDIVTMCGVLSSLSFYLNLMLSFPSQRSRGINDSNSNANWLWAEALEYIREENQRRRRKTEARAQAFCYTGLPRKSPAFRHAQLLLVECCRKGRETILDIELVYCFKLSKWVTFSYVLHRSRICWIPNCAMFRCPIRLSLKLTTHFYR